MIFPYKSDDKLEISGPGRPELVCLLPFHDESNRKLDTTGPEPPELRFSYDVIRDLILN